MYYSIKKILSIVLKTKKIKSGHFLFYDKDNHMLCDTDWCYRVKEKRVKLSELTIKSRPKISTDYYIKIKEDIANRGFDYSKGYITTRKSVIANGHHRYLILHELFGDDYEIDVLEFLDIKNATLHYIFLFLFMFGFIKPIKAIYKFLKSIIN
jgi:hypothetical protein